MRSPHTTTKTGPHSPQLEKAHEQQRSNTAKKEGRKERRKEKKDKILDQCECPQISVLPCMGSDMHTQKVGHEARKGCEEAEAMRQRSSKKESTNNG